MQNDPLPHTKELIAEKRYADASEYLGYFMTFEYVNTQKEAQQLHTMLEEKRDSSLYRIQKIGEGVFQGTSDEAIGQTAAIVSDFFLIGDIRDFTIEGMHYMKDEEVDEIILGLSSIGLIASASTIYTFGASSAPKVLTSILKQLKRTKTMPRWLGKFLLREIKIAKNTKSVKRLKPFLNDMHTLYKHTDIRGTMKLISKSANPNQLKTLSKLSSRFGKETTMLANLSKQGELIKSASKLEKNSLKTMKYASTFGDGGYKALARIGESKFLKSIKWYKSITKVVYKGELLNLFTLLKDYISSSLLWITSTLSALLLFPFRNVFRKKVLKEKTFKL
jgi:hypothetical protein